MADWQFWIDQGGTFTERVARDSTGRTMPKTRHAGSAEAKPAVNDRFATKTPGGVGPA
jgi:N-methylhydantoinase A/oxoprolinase/acetone carboxylase beta subunit